MSRACCSRGATARRRPAAPLMDAVYDELRRLARGYLVRERRNHSLPATALVHEAYLKLVDQRRVRWQNRAHFFAVASSVMRRLLVDHARARGAAKRGVAITVSLDGVDVPATAGHADLLALDAALDKLAALDPRQARLVELRFFGGLTIDEAAVGPGRRRHHRETGLGDGPDLAVPRARWPVMTDEPGLGAGEDAVPRRRWTSRRTRATRSSRNGPTIRRSSRKSCRCCSAYPAAEGFLSTPPDPAQVRSVLARLHAGDELGPFRIGQPDRRRRDGRGLPRLGHAARPRGGDQGAAARIGDRCCRARAFEREARAISQADAPAHQHAVRRRDRRRSAAHRPIPGHGAGGWRDAGRAPHARPAPARSGAGHRDRDRRRAGGGSRGRRGPPRHQAREHHADAVGREAARFRPRPAPAFAGRRAASRTLIAGDPPTQTRAPCSARCRTWRPSSCAARRSMRAPICLRSARCSTRC